MNEPTKLYKMTSLAGPFSREEIPKIKIDYRGLVAYARKKGCKVFELSDEEKNKFIFDADMNTVRKYQIRERENLQ